MNTEQSIDDILKMLKDSVSSESDGASELPKEKKQRSISDQALQKQLKSKYFSDVSETDVGDLSEDEYVIDSDFLQEALQSSEDLEPLEDNEPEIASEQEEQVLTDRSEEQAEPMSDDADESLEITDSIETLEESEESVLTEREQTAFDEPIIQEDDVEDEFEDEIVSEISEQESADILDSTPIIKEETAADEDILDDVETVDEHLEADEDLVDQETVDEEVAQDLEPQEAQAEELLQDEQYDAPLSVEDIMLADAPFDIDENTFVVGDISDADIESEYSQEDTEPVDEELTEENIDPQSESESEPEEETEEEIEAVAEDIDEKAEESELIDQDPDQETEQIFAVYSEPEIQPDSGIVIVTPEDSENNIPDNEEQDKLEYVDPYSDLSIEQIIDGIIAEKEADVPFDEPYKDTPLPEIDETADELPEDNVDELLANMVQIASESDDNVQPYEDEIFDEPQGIQIPLPESPVSVITEVESYAQHETLLATMRKKGIEAGTYEPESLDIPEEQPSEDVIQTPAQEPDYDIIDEALDMSTINIMMQFCDKDELDKTIGDQSVDNFLKQENATVTAKPQGHISNGKEYIDSKQAPSIRSAYRHRMLSKLFAFIGCALLAIITLIYDMLPVIDIRLPSIMNYHSYPAVYALIGLQMLVFVIAILHKDFWLGLKRAFSLIPNRYSAVSVILAATVVYDVIIVLIITFADEDLPYLYNGIAALLATLCAFGNYIDTVAQMRAFGVYSDDAKKFTLTKESAKSAIGAKMYAGGMNASKNIYSITPVDFPNGFFKNIGTVSKQKSFLRMCIIPALILGMIATVVSIVLGMDSYSACSAFLICIYAVTPVSVIILDKLSCDIACRTLTKRASAFAGESAIEKYSGCDVMVFADLHMFKKCRTEDVGMAIYDNRVGYLVLGCLQALYSKLGGPLSGLSIELPDVFRFDRVSIRRITQNGVEAIVDGKHSIIVGEREFMQRYGLIFPPNEREDGRSTLCISLNGGVSAKLSVKYQPEPLFEMLAQRLSDEGISCAIHTFDPLINSTMISNSRTIGECPISVIHGSTQDFDTESSRRYDQEGDGVIACSSRLKLAEILVWLKKLSKLRKIFEKISWASAAIGAVLLVLIMAFDAAAYVNQIYLLLFVAVQALVCALLYTVMTPRKNYFTVDALYKELEREHTRDQNKNKNA